MRERGVTSQFLQALITNGFLALLHKACMHSYAAYLWRCFINFNLFY